MRIIPAIDLLDGQCVRLYQGNYNEVTHYPGDPLEIALKFQESGADLIHVVDLNGARTGEKMNYPIIERLISGGAKIELSGGLRSREDVNLALELGVSQVVLGSKIASDQSFRREIFKEFGGQVVAGVDLKNGRVAIQGWETVLELTANEFIRDLEDCGCQMIIVTDVATDGAGTGPNLPLIHELISISSMAYVHSGGIATVEHLEALAAVRPPISGAILGKSLYSGQLNLDVIRRFNQTPH